MKVIKIDGREEAFDMNKIRKAISKAVNNLNTNIDFEKLQKELNENFSKLRTNILNVEEIHNIIEKSLYSIDRRDIANEYNSYRLQRNKIRDTKSTLMKSIKNIGVQTDRDE